MSWLLDTNVLSELRKGARTDAGVARWFDAADEAQLFTSVLVIGEIRQGIESVRRRDARAARALDKWLRATVENYADRIIAIDREIAERWGELNVPDRLPTTDGLLAATALVHGLTVVTRNGADFERTGVEVIDPFER